MNNIINLCKKAYLDNVNCSDKINSGMDENKKCPLEVLTKESKKLGIDKDILKEKHKKK